MTTSWENWPAWPPSSWPAGREPQRYPRVDKWLRTRGKGIGPISWDGARLLDDRLRLRRRATVLTLGLGEILGLALTVPLGRRDPPPSGLPMTVYFVVTACALALSALVVRVGERRIGRRQTVRVSDAGLPSFSAGDRRGLALLGLASTLQMTLALVAFGATGDRSFLLMAALVVFAGAVLAASAIQTALGEATLAVDAGSLASDRRLRTDTVLAGSAWTAAGGVYGWNLPLAWTGSHQTVHTVAIIGVVGSVVLLVVGFLLDWQQRRTS